MEPWLYQPVLRLALNEDLGTAGDLTSEAVVPDHVRGKGLVIARESGTIAGLVMGCDAFLLLDPTTTIEILVSEGTAVEAGAVLATVSGRLRALLGAERVCLNLLGHLSGIATATRALVQAVAGTNARVACTRKTTPGLRALEKYAVRMGGGINHRFGLDDAILVKDNHLVVAGGVKEAVARVRARVGHLVKVEVEVDNLDQLEEAIEAGVDAVLLDNMDLAELRRAVALVGGRVITEASGGIRPETIAEVAATGVSVISVGWLTHSAPSLDVAFDLEKS